MNTAGLVALRFVDSLPDGRWILTVWHGDTLETSGLMPNYSAALDRAEAIRTTMQEGGWRVATI